MTDLAARGQRIWRRFAEGGPPHRFPKGAVLYHGTSCENAKSILRSGFYPGQFFSTSKRVAQQYACLHQRYSQTTDPCILKLVCHPGTISWVTAYSAGNDNISNFFSEEKIPAHCAKLLGKARCRRKDR